MRPIHRTLSGQVYKDLRARFVRGQYLPGERLYEEKIANEFEVSLTPVREAVKLLESEGLVVRQAHRALSCRSFTLQEAKDIYDMRALLEPHATYLAAQSMDSDWLKSMQQVLDDQQAALSREDFYEVQFLSALFHIRIAERSGNQLLADIIERLWLLVPLLRALAWQKSRNRPVRVVDEHRSILDGLIHGPVPAEEVARKHVQMSWQSVENALGDSLLHTDL